MYNIILLFLKKERSKYHFTQLYFPGTKDHFHINLEDEVTRGAVVLKAGELLWPAPPPPSMAVAQTAAKPTAVAKPLPPNPFNETLKDAFLYSTGK